MESVLGDFKMEDFDFIVEFFVFYRFYLVLGEAFVAKMTKRYKVGFPSRNESGIPTQFALFRSKFPALFAQLFLIDFVYISALF